MAARGRGSFPYMALVKPCEHSRGHIYFLIFMILSQNMCPNDILDEFKNGFGWLKNMAARGHGSFPYMALVKPGEHSRGHTYCPIFIKLGQNMCPNDIGRVQNGFDWLKNVVLSTLEVTFLVKCK